METILEERPNWKSNTIHSTVMQAKTSYMLTKMWDIERWQGLKYANSKKSDL